MNLEEPWSVQEEICLSDLNDEEIQELMGCVWLEPSEGSPCHCHRPLT
jgi:hypothetical protein